MKFSDIIGQQGLKVRLKDAISRGRLPHALLLTGPEGVGQLPLALALAQYVNCENPQDDDACGNCASCKMIAKGAHPDLHFVLPVISSRAGGKPVLTDAYLDSFREHFLQNPYLSYEQWQEALDSANKQLFISVHEMRNLKRNLMLKAFGAKYKIAIVWHAEHIRTEGANAFLKLLEEPPDRTLLLMTCTDPSLLLPTITSRCQRLQMERISNDEIKQYLKDDRAIPDARAAELAAISEGSLGNALNFLGESNQAMQQMYADWLRAIYTGRYDKIQTQLAPLLKGSKEFQKLFLQFAQKKIRDGLMFSLGVDELALSSEAERDFQQNFSRLLNADKVGRILVQLDESRKHLAGNAHAQMELTSLSLRLNHILREAV
ncbi:MAG: DNA polymerase III subunit delta' [Bacteroidia bacterium]